MAGITLARYGVEVLVIDKRDESSGVSRALVISTPGMELMRRWGLEEAVRAGAADVEPSAWVTSTIAWGNGVEMPLGYPSDDEAVLISPTRPAWAPQDHHESILLAHLRAATTARVRFSCELLEVRLDDHGVHAVVFDHTSHTTGHVDALYVIAADGAHSAVRDQLGIAMDCPDDLADYERVEFRAQLAEVVGDRHYALYVITRADAAGVLAPRGGATDGDSPGYGQQAKPDSRISTPMSSPPSSPVLPASTDSPPRSNGAAGSHSPRRSPSAIGNDERSSSVTPPTA